MMPKLKHIVIDVETTVTPRHLPWIEGAKLVSLHLKTEDKPPKAWLFNHPESTVSFTRCVQEIQSELDEAEILVNQNLKFDMHWFRWLGLRVDHLKLHCTQIAEYLLQNQKIIMPSLTKLCEIHGVPGKLDKVKELWDAGYETDEIPAETLVPYGNQDVVATEAVYMAQLTRIQNQGLGALCRVQFAAMRMFGRAEYNGLNINCDKLQQQSDQYAEELKKIEQELDAIAEGQIDNWSSPDQKSCFFFGGSYATKITKADYDALSPELQSSYEIEKEGRIWLKAKRRVKGLGFTPPKGSETKKPGIYSTGSGILAGLRCRTAQQRNVLKLIADRSRKAKLKSTYLDGLQKKVSDDGLVHPKYNLSTTITGRSSSSDPNGQNFPRAKTGPVKSAIETRFK